MMMMSTMMSTMVMMDEHHQGGRDRARLFAVEQKRIKEALQGSTFFPQRRSRAEQTVVRAAFRTLLCKQKHEALAPGGWSEGAFSHKAHRLLSPRNGHICLGRGEHQLRHRRGRLLLPLPHLAEHEGSCITCPRRKSPAHKVGRFGLFVHLPTSRLPSPCAVSRETKSEPVMLQSWKSRVLETV